MASAWGVAFGQAWGSAWGGVSPPPVIEIPVDTHDGRPRPDYGQEIRDRERASQDALRATVEREFRRLTGEDNRPEAIVTPLPVARLATKNELRQAARAILPDIKAEGIEASARRLESLLGELQAANVAQRRAMVARQIREDEALILLMTMM